MDDVVATDSDAVAVAKLKLEVDRLRAKLAEAKRPPSFEHAWAIVLAKLLEEAKDCDEVPAVLDADAAWDRVVELVKADEDDVWPTEREFEVRIVYSVTVTGKVTARSEEEAKQLVYDDEPTLRLDDEGPLDDADLDASIDDVEADES